MEYCAFSLAVVGCLYTAQGTQRTLWKARNPFRFSLVECHLQPSFYRNNITRCFRRGENVVLGTGKRQLRSSER